ncbi:MAG: acyl-CoA dehydrogenase family protein [Polyangiaceae bacterium]|nr:acyl-CoA dehydrogenase family protein [Polyangiaceae bacterium]
MDFALDETEKAVKELATKIFTDRVTQAALRKAEADPDRVMRELWKDLADAGLLGVAIPEAHGGGGHGLLTLVQLLAAAGASAALVPLLPTLALGALPIARFGTPEQAAVLSRVAAGEVFLSAALVERAHPAHDAPHTRARREGAAYVLGGQKVCVPGAHLASGLVVSAATPEGPRLFLVKVPSEGVALERQIVTTEEIEATVTFTGARAEALGGEGALPWLLDHARVCIAAVTLGVAERALRMTAEYTAQRKQFDRPIATFQAVTQRVADAYIDVEAIRLSTLRAASKLQAGQPATEEAAIAKLWAAEGGHRVAFAAQHLHGGMGFDRDYPLHRYYTRARHLELMLGGAPQQLDAIGAAMLAG